MMILKIIRILLVISVLEFDIITMIRIISLIMMTNKVVIIRRRIKES